MYLPKKENFKKLNKLYDNVNWDLEYDKLYLSNKSYNEKNIKRKKIITIENIKEESNIDYLNNILIEYNLHLKKGGTKFGFICYLNEEKIMFKCSTCQNNFLIEYISVGLYKDKINLGACKNCNYENVKKWKKTEIGKNWQNHYVSERRKTDSIFKFKDNVRSLISSSFKRNKDENWKKKNKTEEILGCKFDFFKKYIENQFTKGMTLDNHGEWHLDHIKPLALAKTEEEVVKLNHYTNFQPLWAEDNLKKGSKY